MKWITKAEARRIIRDREYFLESAGGHLNGISVSVVNIRIRKDRVFADIIVYKSDDNMSLRWNNAEFDRGYFKKII